MHRRTFVCGLAVAGGVGSAGCLGDDETAEQTGRGTLRIENRSGGSIRVAYGLLETEEPLDVDVLESIQLTVDGDSFEAVYPDVTGGPYRFVAVAPDRQLEPIEQEWHLDDCSEFGATARVLPDALNISGTRCVRRV